MSANIAKIAKVTRIFLACEKHDKYRKNNKFNKILHLEKEETKNGSKMSANIAKKIPVTFAIFAKFAISSIFF